MANHIPLHACLLGATRITSADAPVRLPQKAVGLIAWLAANAGSVHDREVVAGLLWPRSERRGALHSLSQAIYVIKKRLGPESLQTQQGKIGIGKVDSDVVQFNEAIARQDWMAAANIYGGGFLADLDLNGMLEFSHWVDAKRLEFFRKAKEATLQLQSSNAPSAAAELAELLLLDSPNDPELVRVVTRSLLQTEGIYDAQRYAQSLPEEPRRVARNLINESEEYTLNRPEYGFVGRDSAMQWLQDRYGAALHDRATMVVIDGEPGVGKTVLLERLARLLALRGARVLQAFAYEAEQKAPWGVVSQWIDDLRPTDLDALPDHPWLNTLRSYFPPLSGKTGTRTVDEKQIGYQGFLESLRRLLAEIAGSRPLVLTVDDVHFADATSLSFLHYLLRRSESDQIFVVAAMRSGRDSLPSRVMDWKLVDRYPLVGFSREEAALLVEQIDGETSGSSLLNVDDLLELTGGNPLLISILAKEELSGSVRTAETHQTIADFFRPRLEQHSAEARRLLAALSIFGGPSSLDQLAQIAGVSNLSAESALSELVEANLVNISGSEFSLPHALVGEAAVFICSPVEKQQMHGRAARRATLSARPTTLAAVSHDLAGNRVQAFEASVNASRACDVLHARSEKEFFLKLAMANAPTPRNEIQVRIELAELYNERKKPSEALELLDFSDSSDLTSLDRKKAALTRLRIQAGMTGDINALCEIWEQVKETAVGLSPLDAIDTYVDIVKVAYDLGLDGVASEAADRIENDITTLPLTREIARRSLVPLMVVGLLKGYDAALAKMNALPEPQDSEPLYMTSFLVKKGSLLVAAGDLRSAEKLFAVSLGLVERFALFDEYYAVNNNLAVCLMEQGKFDQASEHFHAAIEYARADTSPSQYATGSDNLTILAYESSDFDRAVELGSHLLTADGPASGVRTLMSLHAIVGLSALELGRLRQCREAERELRILLQRHGSLSNDLSYVHTFLARMAALRGDASEAIEDLGAAREHYRGRNLLAQIRVEVERVRILIRNGIDCREEIRTLLETAEPTCARPMIIEIQELWQRAEIQFS